MAHRCPDCSLTCACTPGEAHIYHCTHYLDCNAVDPQDDFKDEDSERCPECGAYFEEFHEWDCSRSDDDYDDEDEDLDDADLEEWEC